MSQPNVLLIVLDSVRAGNVSHLGYPRKTTPRIDDFTSRATTYTNARSPGIHSISSHVSLFTGYHVAEHRATAHSARLKPGHTIWEELADSGYRTGLFTPNSIVAESSNLASFFHHVEGPDRQELRFPEALGPAEVPGDPSYWEYLRACLGSGSPLKSIVNGLSREFGGSTGVHDPEKEHGGEYVRKFLDWKTSEVESGPWAACLNLMDAHYPYLPREEFETWSDKRLRDLHQEAMGGPLTTRYLGERPFWELEASESLYDDCIRQADAYVGGLIDTLDESGDLDETLIVVTSDHGEGFGEYSVVNDAVRLIDHSWGIGDEVSHVPLVVRHPGQSTGERIEAPASLTNFSEVVRSMLDGRDEDFVPASGQAITTSYRVQKPADELPVPEDEREPYFGPWHTLCQEQDGGVVVDAVRRDDAVQYWPSLDGRIIPTCTDREAVESVIESFECVDVTDDDDDIGANVQQRLKRLGYIS